ncbi:MAG TPA: nicotinate-nucleotide adenylyltransferase [Melioribacteraceae bacterium]|nr:nicotinate-nucleotide adenylyltransferase [Melioribacteraceae bacterium]
MKNRIGIFGGSFDPVHTGHLILAQYVLEQRNLNRIIFIPCHISPHKTGQKITSGVHRLNMVKLAVENIPYLEFSDYEILKGDISYTYDTLKHFSGNYDEIELIIGYDNLLVFEKWNNPDEIIKLARLIVIKRKTDIIDERNRFFDSAVILDTPTIEISSTDIRDRISRGRTIDFLVPEPVKKYIYEKKLYR